MDSYTVTFSLAKQILPELEGDPILRHDASTNALIEYFRANQ